MGGSLFFRSLFVIAILLNSASAAAHPAPFSYLDFNLSDDAIRGSVVVHDFDAAHELGIANPESLRDPNVVRAHEAALYRLVDSRLKLVADGKTLTPRWVALEAVVERQSLRLSFAVTQPVRGTLDIA